VLSEKKPEFGRMGKGVEHAVPTIRKRHHEKMVGTSLRSFAHPTRF
jgi:hypothetical protein